MYSHVPNTPAAGAARKNGGEEQSLRPGILRLGQRTGGAVARGRLAEADIENIAEEIETMGRSEKRELINR